MPFNTSSPRHIRKLPALLRMLVCIFFLFFRTLGFGQNPEDEVPDYEHLIWEDLVDQTVLNLDTDEIPISIEVGPDNYLYILTFGNGVEKRNLDGELEESNFISGLISPLDMTIDSDGFFYIADYSEDEGCSRNGRIKIFTPNGTLDRTIYTGIYRPIGVDVDEEGNIYVAEYNREGNGCEGDELSRISVYNTSGSRIVENNSVLRPYRIAVSSNKTVYVSQEGGNDPAVLTLDNNLNITGRLPDIQSPGSIKIDDFGFIHVVEYAGRIDFSNFLNIESLGFGEVLDIAEEIDNGIDDEAFFIRIYNEAENYRKPITEEIDFPVDIAFDSCNLMFVNNAYVDGESNPILGYLPEEFEFDLEIYNRTPSFDTEAPVAVCIDSGEEFTLQNGSITITPEDIDNGSTDNCEIVDMQVSPSSFSEPGEEEITLTVTDAAGNTDECTTTITIVEDEEEPTPPEATCNNITLELDENGEATLTAAEVYDGDASEYDLNIDKENFDCSDIGENDTITLTVTDEENNLSDTCEAIITVEDNRSPEIECQGDITTSTEAGEDFAVVTFSEPEYSDNCNSSIEQTQGLPSGSQFEVGTHTIEFTVNDSSDNTATCSFEIIVEDEPQPSDPEFDECPGDISENNDPGDCGAVVNFDKPTASDDSGDLDVELVSDLGPGDLFPVGSTTVEYEATGENGETATCSFEVVVTDNEAPEIISCPEDIEVEIPSGEDSAIVEYDEPEFTDNCNIVDVQRDGPASGSDFEPGMYEVEYEVSDDSGNTSTCTFSIMVSAEDQENLEFDCVDSEVILDENGQASVNAEDLYVGEENAWKFSLSQDSFECSDLGTNNLTLTAIDPATGATGSCELSLEVMDVNAPVAQCVEDFSLNLDSSGQASLSAADLNLNSSDNCGIESLEIDKTTFTSADLGTNTVTLTVTDAAGNFDTCEVTVRLTDEEQETDIECVEEVPASLDENGEVQLVLEDFYTGNANGLELEASQLEFDCSNLGENTVIFSWSGEQEGSCEIPVIIEDDIEPVLRTESISLQLNEEGLAEISPEDLDVGSYDNCGELNFSLGQNIFTCKDAGNNLVLFTATDAAGNTTSRNVEVFVNADLGTCSETGRDFDYLFIYPNPTNREFKVYTPDGVEVERIIVFDKRGRFIAEKEFSQNEELSMELEGVQNSVYTLQIFTNEGEEIRRLIIRK